MPIEVITEFISKATVRIIAYVYNDAGTLVEPTSVLVTIYDPDGGDPVVDEEDIVVSGKVDDGIYEYYYHKDIAAEPMDKGQWRGDIAVVDGSGTGAVISTGHFSFKVR